MLHFFGKNQGKVKAKIVADGNKIHTPGGLHVRVVNSYVHLGSTMGDDNADVEHRHNACMQSYVQIAHSVFENCCFRVRDRVNLARSLCFFPPSVQRSTFGLPCHHGQFEDSMVAT